MINELKDIFTYTALSDADGKKIGTFITSPLAIHTPRFDIYRDWDIIKVLVFETFIIYSKMYGNPFYKPRKFLIEDLRLSKHALLKNLDFLIEQGYISKRLSGPDENYKNYYTVNYDKIIDKIDVIYRFAVFGEEGMVRAMRENYIRIFEKYEGYSEKREDSPLYRASIHYKK